MYDIVSGIIDHTYATGDSGQQYVYYILTVIIPLFTVIIADSMRFVFRAFLGRRK